MADEKYTFGTARVRLEEIASEVRKKDTSLEKSLDLLEEGVRLANICTELVDHTDMTPEPVDESDTDGVVVGAEAAETAVDAAADDGSDGASDDEGESSDAASVE